MWTAADWRDYSQTGHVYDQSFAQTDDFTLVGPSDTTGLSDQFKDPYWSVAGNFAALPSINHGRLYARVHERVTGTSTHLDLWLSAGAADPQTVLNPSYVVSVGVPPRRSVQALRGRLLTYSGPVVRSTTGAGVAYTISLDIPASAGVVSRISLVANPWSPGAFLVFGGAPFDFNL